MIALAGSAEKCEFARHQGADEAIDYRAEDPVASIRKHTTGSGVDLLLDIASGNTLPLLFEALSTFGVVVSYGFLEGEPAVQTVAAMRKRFGQSPARRLFSMHSFDALHELRREVTKSVVKAFAEGAIDPCIYRTFPLRQAPDAHALFEEKVQRGKLILIP